MKLKAETIGALVISLIPLILCLQKYELLVDVPSTNTDPSSGLSVSKPVFVVVVFCISSATFFFSDLIARKMANIMLPTYKGVNRIVLTALFMLLNLLLVLSNMKHG
jgi:hypothetical protein